MLSIFAKSLNAIYRCLYRHNIYYLHQFALERSARKIKICPEMHALAKMAEMAINRQNRQTINKNSIEMAKGPSAKWRFWRKWRIWRKWQKWRLIAKIAKL